MLEDLKDNEEQVKEIMGKDQYIPIEQLLPQVFSKIDLVRQQEEGKLL